MQAGYVIIYEKYGSNSIKKYGFIDINNDNYEELCIPIITQFFLPIILDCSDKFGHPFKTFEDFVKRSGGKYNVFTMKIFNKEIIDITLTDKIKNAIMNTYSNEWDNWIFINHQKYIYCGC
jgi:hypothetical protein